MCSADIKYYFLIISMRPVNLPFKILFFGKMKVEAGITEELKATDQMKWVGLMNNVRSSAEEIVLKELIYV